MRTLQGRSAAQRIRVPNPTRSATVPKMPALIKSVLATDAPNWTQIIARSNAATGKRATDTPESPSLGLTVRFKESLCSSQSVIQGTASTFGNARRVVTTFPQRYQNVPVETGLMSLNRKLSGRYRLRPQSKFYAWPYHFRACDHSPRLASSCLRQAFVQTQPRPPCRIACEGWQRARASCSPRAGSLPKPLWLPTTRSRYQT